MDRRALGVALILSAACGEPQPPAPIQVRVVPTSMLDRPLGLDPPRIMFRAEPPRGTGPGRVLQLHVIFGEDAEALAVSLYFPETAREHPVLGEIFRPDNGAQVWRRGERATLPVPIGKLRHAGSYRVVVQPCSVGFACDRQPPADLVVELSP